MKNITFVRSDVFRTTITSIGNIPVRRISRSRWWPDQWSARSGLRDQLQTVFGIFAGPARKRKLHRHAHVLLVSSEGSGLGYLLCCLYCESLSPYNTGWPNRNAIRPRTRSCSGSMVDPAAVRWAVCSLRTAPSMRILTDTRSSRMCSDGIRSDRTCSNKTSEKA